MSKLISLLAVSLLLWANSAHALVDMRNANYSDTWVDLQVKGSAYDLRLQRSYNSRTLFNGIFGFGWCSEFETSLQVTAEKSLRIVECGAGLEIEYSPQDDSGVELNKVVADIMKEVRKRNPRRDERYFKNLETDIRRDSALRTEFARQLKFDRKAVENSKYVANGRATDHIVFKGGEYVRQLPNGTSQKFNRDGKLTYMSDRNGNFLKLTYRAGKLATVADNTGGSIQFKFHDNSKFVKQVVGPKGLSSTYKYAGENLVEVKNAWKNTYKYEYDSLYNLTKAIFPDKTHVALTYNQDKDWVTSFRDRKGCVETYEYINGEKDPLNHYKSSVEKVCAGKVTNKSSYEFWHKVRKDGVRYLAKSKSVNNGQTIETLYHEEFGRPTEIIQNGAITRFDYYPNGLLMKKTDAARSYAYKYENSCNKVSHVSVTVSFPVASGNKKERKPTKAETQTLSTVFNYDKKRCNLIGAKNSAGQVVSLSYDRRGRIEKILDQSKKAVTITYEERFGKPHIVTRPGLGTIKFKYKEDGSMDKFDSADDPLVAVQVANIFSNLLEVIAPATTDTNNI